MKPRIEQKLSMNKIEYPLFLEWISNQNGEILFPERIICSRYFDNFKMESFSDTLDNIVPRKKIRIRTYNSRDFLSSLENYSLEIKQSTANARAKSTSEITSENQLSNLCNSGIFDYQYGLCLPIVDISYKRHYFSVQSIRITIDENIQYQSIKDKFNDETSTFLDDEMVLEIKTDFAYDTSELMNIFEFPRTRFSKYERAIELLDLSIF